MKRILPLALALFLFALVPVMAATEAELKANFEAAVKLAAAAPQDYALNWQAAQAARKYGDYLVVEETAGWKDTARAAAKEGIKYGEVAFKLNPTGIEGWYWYGLCVGTYSDCVSIIKALAEGLREDQMGFENAYKVTRCTTMRDMLSLEDLQVLGHRRTGRKGPSSFSTSILLSSAPIPTPTRTPGTIAGSSIRIRAGWPRRRPTCRKPPRWVARTRPSSSPR